MDEEPHRRGWWERLAPWLAGLGVVALLAVPIAAYFGLREGQQAGQAEVQQLVNAFKCQQKALDGLLQDVPLAFSDDKNAHDYATIARHCRVPQTPASGAGLR